MHAVECDVDAPPQEVYALVSDITRMGEWSPETDRCAWRQGATGARVGARFRAWNRRRWLRWFNSPVLIAADKGKEFAFDRRVLGQNVVSGQRLRPTLSGRYQEVRDRYAVTYRFE